jgi:hypothetical protein
MPLLVDCHFSTLGAGRLQGASPGPLVCRPCDPLDPTPLRRRACRAAVPLSPVTRSAQPHLHAAHPARKKSPACLGSHPLPRHAPFPGRPAPDVRHPWQGCADHSARPPAKARASTPGLCTFSAAVAYTTATKEATF